MCISDGQCCSSPSLSHLCFSPSMDSGHAPSWTGARAVVSCIFRVPHESWLRRGQCIAEEQLVCVLGCCQQAHCLLLFSCGSSELPWLSWFSLVLAVVFKADQVNCLWMPKNCSPLVRSNPHVVFYISYLFPGCFLAISFPSKWCEGAASLESRAVTVCCPDCRDLRETQLRSSGCVWELQKVEIQLTCK